MRAIFGDPATWPDQDLIAASEEFSASLVVGAYLEGAFPMPMEEFGELMCWWSPVWRGVLPPAQLRVTRSLRKSAKHYRVTEDTAFTEVVRRCADPSREGAWIDDAIASVYEELHHMGIAHSVEVWSGETLVGGLYGVGIGGLFAGESMFHDPERGRDASKVALLRLVRILSDDGVDRLLDVQWVTDHLESLGAVEVPREEYLRQLRRAISLPEPAWPNDGGDVDA